MEENEQMEYVKKTSLGRFHACGEEDATHILQTKEEYAEMIGIATMYRDNAREAEAKEYKAKEKYSTLLSENKQLRKDNASLRVNLSSLHEKISHSAQFADLAASLEKEKNALSDRIAELEQAVDQAKGLNRNLLRISRERANADRRLSPKKEHDGYLVLQSREWRERLSDRSTMHTWKSVIQTPYDASMEPEIAKNQIFDDLVKYVLSDLGVNRYIPAEEGNCLSPEDGDTGNTLYCWRYEADYRSGYWTIIIYTINPLVVPAERRAKQGRKKHT